MTSSGHSVNETYVYGPVTSRRYGTTIGINLLPLNSKVCNFDCVYCQLGENFKFIKAAHGEFPAVQKITDELADYFNKHKNEPIDHIVISGNGEPTLHPRFAEMIAMIRDYAGKIKIPVVCLTNGTRISDAKIAAALKSLDECALKFDFAGETINRPLATLVSSELAEATKNFPNLTLQCCLALYEGATINENQLADWLTDINKFNTQRIDFYSLSREPAVANVFSITDADWDLLKKTACAALPHRPLHFLH